MTVLYLLTKKIYIQTLWFMSIWHDIFIEFYFFSIPEPAE